MTYHDHHFHPLGYTRLVNGLDLFAATDLAGLLDMISDFAAENPGPVIGQRLNDEGLVEGAFPTRTDIDDSIGDRPALIYRYCGHIAVADTAALTLAGVDSSTPDPPGGSFDRDAAGSPNGVLRETAISIVSRALAPLVEPPTDAQVLAALSGLTEMGLGSITGIVSASDPLWCGVGDELETLCRLATSLPIDVLVFVSAATPADLTRAAERIRAAEGRISFGGWKEWSDGSFGGHTAALHEPYADRPDRLGTIRIDPAHAVEMGQTAIGLGEGVAIHAIGDRANDLVLDIHEALLDRGADPSRLRIEHASLLTGAAIERMARLGVTASVQPAFLVSEGEWLPRRLGDGRMDRVYPFRTLSEAGVKLLGGSDTPVESPDPTVGIQAAVDRHGINHSEALDLAGAKALFTPPP